MLAKRRAKARDLLDQIGDLCPVRRPGRRGEVVNAGHLGRNALVLAIEPVEDVSRIRWSGGGLREQQFAFLRVMEALGERVEIVGDQGDGMQVLARRRGRQPLREDAERVAPPAAYCGVLPR